MLRLSTGKNPKQESKLEGNSKSRGGVASDRVLHLSRGSLDFRGCSRASAFCDGVKVNPAACCTPRTPVRAGCRTSNACASTTIGAPSGSSCGSATKSSRASSSCRASARRRNRLGHGEHALRRPLHRSRRGRHLSKHLPRRRRLVRMTMRRHPRRAFRPAPHQRVRWLGFVAELGRGLRQSPDSPRSCLRRPRRYRSVRRSWALQSIKSYAGDRRPAHDRGQLGGGQPGDSVFCLRR